MGECAILVYLYNDNDDSDSDLIFVNVFWSGHVYPVTENHPGAFILWEAISQANAATVSRH